MSRQNSREISNINVSLNGSEIGINRTPNQNKPFSDVKVLLLRGLVGNGIANIEKTSTSGNVDTYTITYDDGNTDTFTVTNGVMDAEITGTPSSSKTLTAFSILNGVLNATFADIDITKSQVSDFPSAMPASGGTADKVGHNLAISYVADNSLVEETYDGSADVRAVRPISLTVTISSSNWSSVVDADGYYTNQITLDFAFNTYLRPDVTLCGASADTVPTANEAAAYNLTDLFYMPTSANTTTFIAKAKTKPSTTYYVTIDGYYI